MNDPTAPLRPETLDELLSADLDGELARAATDLGLSPAAAEAAIATPAAVARRAALVRARDLVAPVPALDPADVDRLVAGAQVAARQERELAAARRSRRRFDAAQRVVGAAAAVAVVVAGVAVLAHLGGGQSSKSSAGGSKAATAAPKPQVAELGDVSSPDRLRAQVLQRLPGGQELAPQPTTAAPPDTPATSQSPEVQKNAGSFDGALRALVFAGPQGPQAAAGSTAYAADAAGRRTRADCVASLIRTGRVPAAPAFSGRGVSQGRPVYVVAFRVGRGYDVYVLAAGNCSVLRRTTVS